MAFGLVIYSYWAMAAIVLISVYVSKPFLTCELLGCR